MIYKDISLETCENDLMAVFQSLSHFINATIELREENNNLKNEIEDLNNQLNSCNMHSQVFSDFLSL
jgi:hypothetical protein